MRSQLASLQKKPLRSCILITITSSEEALKVYEHNFFLEIYAKSSVT